MDVQEVGTGPAVVLLHGTPMHRRAWAGLGAALSRHARVVMPALPGYDGSPALAEPYSFDEALARLEAALLERGVSRASVVGTSLGGYRALSMALRGVVTVERIVLLGGFAAVEPEARAAFREVVTHMRAGVDLRDAIAASALAPQFAAGHPDMVAEVRSWFDAAAPGVVAAELDALARSEDLRPRLAELSMPILARVGELDLTAPPARSEDIVRQVARGELQVVAGCGHLPLVEDAPATIDATVAFLSRR